MNIIRHSFRLTLPGLFKPPLLQIKPLATFSEYFRTKDQQEIVQYLRKQSHNKKYRNLLALWQRPLEKKRLRQARVKEIKKKLEENPPQKQDEKLIIHNPAIGIEHPPFDDNVFGIAKVDDRQYKLMKNCILILDTKQDHEINKNIVFDEVLMIGTNTYTLLGRPFVGCAKIKAVIESIFKSEKTIVFKKKRRKQYKKSRGQRSQLTSCRITEIQYEIPEEIMNKAVGL